VAIPPLPEQCAITRVLSDVDVLMRELERLITKKRNIKKATMQQLLTGQTRLPGFNVIWLLVTFLSIPAHLSKVLYHFDRRGTTGSYPLFVSGGEMKRLISPPILNTEALIFSDGGVFDVRYY
jgi:type I restriction enzyme S subunit